MERTRPRFSRRDFLAGALATGTLSAAATYLTPGGRALSSAEIRFATGVDPTGARDLLVEMWNRVNPKSTVRVNLVEGSTDNQSKTMVDLVNAGAVDVLNLDVIAIPFFQEQKHLREVELEDPNGFLPKCLLTSRLGLPDPQPYWAVPFNTDVGMLFQRLVSDFDAKAPQPVLVDAVDKLVGDGSARFAAQLKPVSESSNEAFVVNVLEHALCRDPQLLDPANGLPVLDVKRWRNALEPLRTAVAKGRFTRADTEDATRTAFGDPRNLLPYMRNWPVKYRELQQSGDVDTKGSRVRVGELPVGILGGQSLAVASTAENVDRATAFIRFMTGLPAQKVLASYGLPPVRFGAYGEPSVQAFIPHLEAVKGAVEKARPRPVSPRYSAFSEVVVTYGKALLDDGRDLTSDFTDDMKKALGI